MKIFLSYASEDVGVAEEIHLALLGAGHDVFFDKPVIGAGKNYMEIIAQEIKDCDGMVFLISPKSIAAGSYTLSELRAVREKWLHPQMRILPITIKSTKYETIPAYLRAVTILQPEGNIAAEAVAEIEKWNTPRLKKTDYNRIVIRWFMLVLSTVMLTIGLGTLFSISYPRVSVDLRIAILIVLVSAIIVLAVFGIWSKVLRNTPR